MIFVTVGTQLPFDRLLRAVDSWASKVSGRDVIAQAGRTTFSATTIQVRQFMSEPEYDELFARAELIIAHAGMGAIISAINAEKPIILCPRYAALGEHRNDHQLDTARRFSSLENVFVCDKDRVLPDLVDEVIASRARMSSALRRHGQAQESDVGRAIRAWLESGDAPAEAN